MIIYDLVCASGHRFEGWFASAREFERQLASGLVICPECGGLQVRRALSPIHIGGVAVVNEEPAEAVASATGTAASLASSPLTELAVLREQVEAASEDVGGEFAAEARRIHYQQAPERAIRGQASSDDYDALRDEGIEVFRLPAMAKDKFN
jgi:hypothetical protein